MFQRCQRVGLLAFVSRECELLEHEGLSVVALSLPNTLQNGSRDGKIVLIARQDCLLHEHSHRFLQRAPHFSGGRFMPRLLLSCPFFGSLNASRRVARASERWRPKLV